MSHSNKRYERTIERIGAEAFWLNTYQNAICGLTVDAIGLDFFRVSLNALKDARLIRLIRIFEDDDQTASFWYLVKCNEKIANKVAKATQTDLLKIKDISDRLLSIRNKTFVHIDKQKVFDPQSLYIQAGITHDEVQETINSVWRFMRQLHLVVLERELEGDEYTGEDIMYLAELRDKDIFSKRK